VAETDVHRDVHINIQIDGEHYRLDRQQMTGKELFALAGVAAGNQLFREVPGPADDDPIRPEDIVQLHSGEKFYTVPVGNFG